jgi:hypothetical protein
MRAHPILIGVSALLASAGIGLAQTSSLTSEPRTDSVVTPYGRPSANPVTTNDPLNSNVANPYANPAPAHRGIRNPYFGEDNPYVTSTATPRRAKPPTNPAETAAQQQTGLNNSDARSLLQQQGYASVTDLHAEPNSVWAWQADAIKNGRRVRLGIDQRGNLLELGASTQPCVALGAGFGSGPLGTGARISEANRCANR